MIDERQQLNGSNFQPRRHLTHNKEGNGRTLKTNGGGTTRTSGWPDKGILTLAIIIGWPSERHSTTSSYL